jgi:hypothetical protein
VGATDENIAFVKPTITITPLLSLVEVVLLNVIVGLVNIIEIESSPFSGSLIVSIINESYIPSLLTEIRQFELVKTLADSS